MNLPANLPRHIAADLDEQHQGMLAQICERYEEAQLDDLAGKPDQQILETLIEIAFACYQPFAEDDAQIALGARAALHTANRLSTVYGALLNQRCANNAELAGWVAAHQIDGRAGEQLLAADVPLDVVYDESANVAFYHVFPVTRVLIRDFFDGQIWAYQPGEMIPEMVALPDEEARPAG